MRICRLWLPVLLLAACLCSGAAAEASPRVEQVKAEVTSAGSLPELARLRMQESVAAIAGQLMTGQPLSKVEAEKEQHERLIGEVFNKVLVGYSVAGVAIVPGEITLVQIGLVPWDATIRDTVVDIRVEGMPPDVERLVLEDAAGLQDFFRESLQGLPVAAADWTASPIKHALAGYLETHLPEFRADFEVMPGEVSQVSVVLYPRLPVVRTLDLSMRSDTIPNFTLLGQRGYMEQEASALIGVPVAFVDRHRAFFERDLAEKLDARADFRRLQIYSKVTLVVGEHLQVMSRSDTERYRLRLEGWLDIARRESSGHGDDRNLRVRLHGGIMLSPWDEIFARADVTPLDQTWFWELGYAHSFKTGTELAVRYDMREHRPVVGASQALAPAGKWLMRYEYRWADSQGEAALRYRLHDFLAMEFVHDKDDGWLRLIGYF